MCCECLTNPCHPRCPNASDPKWVYNCGWCGQPIFEEEEYMETPNGPVCKECIEGMSVAEFMELTGEEFSVAKK